MRRQIASVLLAVSLATVCLCGCSVDGKQVFFQTLPSMDQVFRIGSLSCSKKTAAVYLANYYNIYGSAGNLDLRTASLNTDRLKENIQKACLHRLSMVYALNVYASENSIYLDQQEKAKAQEAADKYMDSLSAADKEALGVSATDIRRMYEDEELAAKVYESIVEKTDDEVSDDEARVMDAVVITLDPSERDKEKSAIKDLENGSDIQIVAKKYSSEKKTSVTIDKLSWPEEVSSAAFELEDGEYSQPIRSEGSIYIIYCVSKFNEEKSEENRQKIIDSRKKEVLEGILEEQNLKDYSSIDEKTWQTVADSIDEKVTTDSFFELLSE